MKTTKKILAVVLSVMLLLSVMPFAAFAGSPGASDSGSGIPGSGVDINPVSPATVLPTVTATDITAEGYDTAYEYTYANDGDAQYANYYGDITVSFDRAIEADDVVLAGSYDNFQSGAWTQVALRDLAAGEEFRIVKDGLVGSAVTFSKLIAITGGDFRCAAKGTDVSGVTMTVKFNLYETKTSTEAIEIAGGTKTYTFPVVNYVAEANGVKYESFDEALRAISTVNANGQFLANGTLRLLADCAGNGYSIASGSNLIIDFNGKTYTVDAEPLAGSTGTKTQAFQLLKDSTVIFKNGTLTSTVAKMLVQNYSDLTLEGMTLTLDNPNYYPSYTLSNNNGDTMIIDSTINANPAGGFAFDVCRYKSYPSVSVTVTGDSEINGDVEIFASKGDPKEGLSLNLNGGTMSGDIVVDESVKTILQKAPESAVIKKAAAFTKDAPEGYEWVEAADGKSATLVKIPEPPTATVTQLPLAQITNVATTDGKTITFDKGYKFVAQDDAESVQDSAYKTYSADYVITSDTALPAGSVTLGGQYDFDGENTPWVTLTSTDDIPANTEVRLLNALLGEAVYTYEDICTLVKEFKCAVKTNDASVAGADITVELRIYETEYNPETGLYEETGAEPIAIDDVVYELETPKVAQIGNVRYETLEAAFAAAKDGDTITLLDDCAGNGIKVLQGKFNNQGLTVDFAGHTYTVDGTTVGSTGTETQGFQLLKDNNITFQNGKIYGDSNVTTSLMFLIQNYSNLTLDNMELELIGRYYNQYTLSNNNGNIVIDDSIINAPDYSWAGLEPSDAGSFAFDVCRNFNYPSVSVTVTGDSVINGDIQMDALNGDAKDGMKLNLVSGTMNGNIVLTEDAEAAIAAAPEKAEAKKAATFAVDAPEGYEWNEEGVLVPVAEPDNGQSITLTDGIESNIYLDADAYGVDEDEAIVKVTYNKNSDLNNTEVQRGTDTYALKDMTKYVNPQSPWNGNYIIAQSQAPAQMHEEILVELYANAAAEEPVGSITTSAAALCEEVIATSNDAEYVALCKSLLDYGRSAQILFNYDLATLADSYYNENLQNMTAADMMKTIPASMSGVSFKGVSMTVLSTTKWNIITNTAETVSGITGGSEDASAASGTLADGNTAIIVSGINAADFAKAFTVETNNGYVTLSAAMIARAIVKASVNNNYKDLARAFYAYGCAAEAFFA